MATIMEKVPKDYWQNFMIFLISCVIYVKILDIILVGDKRRALPGRRCSVRPTLT